MVKIQKYFIVINFYILKYSKLHYWNSINCHNLLVYISLTEYLGIDFMHILYIYKYIDLFILFILMI